MSAASAMTSMSASARRAEDLDVDLVELAEAALLRPLVAEHRTGVQKNFSGAAAWSARDIGAADTGGVFRPQGEHSPPRSVKCVHLLGDDVGVSPIGGRTLR